MTNKDKNAPLLTWNEEGLPTSTHFDDVYFSKENGLEESRYVFLEGNDLSKRWRKTLNKNHFTLFETGFGTGLNFLAAWQLWNASPQTENTLRFISVERFPLSQSELEQALALWPELAELAKCLIDIYPPQPWRGLYHATLQGNGKDIRSVSLSIYFGDIHQAFNEMSTKLDAGPITQSQIPAFGEMAPVVDAWFLDGFAPAKNPDMWASSVFDAIAKNSDEHTSFATFTAAGDVRRGLQAHGFECKKRSGFGRKREMLTGTFKNTAPQKITAKHSRFNTTNIQTWPLKASSQQAGRNKSVIILGAGLAGCHTAFALAQKGFKVTVIEKHGVAMGASGNQQGAVYTRLSDSLDALSDFNLQSQLFADQFYSSNGFYETSGEQCSVLHLADSPSSDARFERFLKTFSNPATHFEYIPQNETAKHAGIALNTPALKVIQSGWLNPRSLCKKLLSLPNIKLIENTEVTSLTFENDLWSAHSIASTHKAELCIVCNAADAIKFDQLASLPLKNIRGQVTHIESPPSLPKLTTVICGKGYIAPSTKNNNQHCIGATFNLNNPSTDLNADDHSTNIQTLRKISSEYLDAAIVIDSIKAGKVGFRCSTPDYFPIVGPVAITEKVADSFSFLSKKSNADIDTCGSVHPGLYCSLGFGSRGLAYTPLAAELLTELISGQYLSVNRSLYTHLHPARFTVRALIKNKKK